MALMCPDPERCAQLASRWSIAADDAKRWRQVFRSWRGRRFRFDPHAVRRQRERGISVADIRSVVSHGQAVHVRHDRRMRSHRYTMIGTLASGRVLHVVAEEVDGMDDLSIITAYDPAGYRDIWTADYTQRLHWCVKTDDEPN